MSGCMLTTTVGPDHNHGMWTNAPLGVLGLGREDCRYHMNLEVLFSDTCKHVMRCSKGMFSANKQDIKTFTQMSQLAVVMSLLIVGISRPKKLVTS